MKELSERHNERASSPNDRFLQHTALSLHVSQYGKCQVCKCLIQVMYVFINIVQNIYSHTHIRTTYIHTRIHIFAHASSIFQFLNLFATFRIGGKQTCMARTWFYSNAQCLSALRYRSFQTAHSTRSASRASSSHLDLATNIHNIMHADYGRKEGGGGNDCDGEQTCV